MSRLLDIERVRELFDLEGSYLESSGGAYRDDPNIKWHELRDSGPVHPGTVHDLSELGRPATFHGLPEEGKPHFSVFSYEACDFVYRNPEIFASAAAGHYTDIIGAVLMTGLFAWMFWLFGITRLKDL